MFEPKESVTTNFLGNKSNRLKELKKQEWFIKLTPEMQQEILTLYWQIDRLQKQVYEISDAISDTILQHSLTDREAKYTLIENQKTGIPFLLEHISQLVFVINKIKIGQITTVKKIKDEIEDISRTAQEKYETDLNKRFDR